MHFVPVKTVEQQAMLAVHTSRSGLMSERTALINRIRAIVGEFGVVLPVGVVKLREQLPQVLEDGDNELPGRTRQLLVCLVAHWRNLDQLITECDREIAQHVRTDPRAQQVQRLLGVGVLGASALVATVGDFAQFSNARQFACWLGLTPSQNSSGGKARLGSITKQGDAYLRMLLVQGAKSAVHLNKPKDSRLGRWLLALKERSGWQKAAVALAAKNARIVWAMLARGKPFDPDHLSVRPA
jgi:transposase